ncbi:hypothetical protein [Streptomyces sp. NPDC004629]
MDAIGRVTQIPVANGSATLTLDGAPRIYYGLLPHTDNAGHHSLPTTA